MRILVPVSANVGEFSECNTFNMRPRCHAFGVDTGMSRQWGGPRVGLLDAFVTRVHWLSFVSPENVKYNCLHGIGPLSAKLKARITYVHEYFQTDSTCGRCLHFGPDTTETKTNSWLWRANSNERRKCPQVSTYQPGPHILLAVQSTRSL